MLKDCDYCDYETCVALKELGYVGICDAYYELTGSEDYNRDSFGLSYTRDFIHPDDIDRVAAPLLYQAQKWLREEKGVYVTVITEYNDYCPVKGVKYRLEVAHWKDDEFGYETIEWLDEECLHTIITFDSYEEALSKGIKAAIEILTNKENE